MLGAGCWRLHESAEFMHVHKLAVWCAAVVPYSMAPYGCATLHVTVLVLLRIRQLNMLTPLRCRLPAGAAVTGCKHVLVA